MHLFAVYRGFDENVFAQNRASPLLALHLGWKLAGLCLNVAYTF